MSLKECFEDVERLVGGGGGVVTLILVILVTRLYRCGCNFD